MDSSNLETISKWPIPKKKKVVQAFSGSPNYYCRFIVNYSAQVFSVIDLTKDVPFTCGHTQQQAFDELCVKAQVRYLCYNSSNLYPNCIIRHMLTKWTDHQPGICRQDVRTALKGLGIRNCVSLGLASCMFTIRCISIIFYCLLFMCYYCISLGILSCIST